MKRFFTILLFTLVSATQAKCLTNDRWTGPDKAQHQAIGAVTGFVVASATDSFWYGVGAAAALGAAKEYADSKHPESHTCSLQDALMTTVGGAFGAGFSRLVITYGDRTVRVSYLVSLP